MPKFEVEFYETPNGDQPAKDFLLLLDKKMRAKMAEGIFELRAKVGSDITRVLYFFYVERHIILTNGFIKKTQKTPRKKSNGQRNITQTICAGRRAANECEI